jgi:hypothetical protein
LAGAKRNERAERARHEADRITNVRHKHKLGSGEEEEVKAVVFHGSEA